MPPKLFIAMKAFVRYQDKILIIQESPAHVHSPNIGKYDVPGGRIEPGESFDTALRREIQEETKLSVEIGKPFYVAEWRPVVKDEQWQVVGTYFECFTKIDTVILGHEHSAYLWIDPREYKSYAIIPNLHPAFEAYLGR